MNALIEILNRWGEAALPPAAQALWQSSLMIVMLLALDLLLRHRIRAGFRYALWMLLLVKLVLPPSFALPTGAGYWIERPVKAEAPVEPPVTEVAVIPPPAVEINATADTGITVDADFFDLALAEATAGTPSATTMAEVPAAPAVKLTLQGRLLAAWLAGTIVLLGWMLGRWRWVNRLVRASEPAPTDLQALLANVCRTSCPTSSVAPAVCRQAGRDRHSVRSDEAGEGANAPETEEALTHAAAPGGALGETRPTIVVRITDAAMSPAVCGLFRPVILLPRKLVGTLSREQLGTVLLHELIHLRRRDLWVNCAQTLLQIAAWWHPLLWMANARIRRVREEAVDEAVACALRDDADAYPATLLEVAKLTFTRPLMTLGLVGILESKSALKQRIRRLLELPPLESTRLKWWQWAAVATIALTALPMAEGQQATDRANDSSVDVPANAESNPTAQLETREFRVNPVTFYQSLERISASLPPYTNSSGAVLNGSQAFQSATEADGVTLLNHFIRAYFDKLSVKLEPPKSVFFNVRKGSLLVRATIEDLEIIQRAIEALDTEPAQITLAVQTVEVPIDDRLATGFNWMVLPNLGEVRLIEATTTNYSVAILTDPQFRVAIKVFEQRHGLYHRSARPITTLSGHTTELKLRDAPLLAAPEFGPLFERLEVNPYALVDRENLQLTIIATIRTRTVDGQGKNSPHAYFVSQKASTAAMKNGETIVLAVAAGMEDSARNDGNLQTLVFITPTVVEPTGSRMHSTEESPFDHGRIVPPKDSGNGLELLQKELANAQVKIDRAQGELRSKREQLRVEEFWLLDDAVLEHPFVKRHVERLGLTPPAEFLAVKEVYRHARNVRDSVDLKIAQEVINRQIEARLQAGSAPEVNSRSEAAVREQLDFFARSVDQMRIEYQAATERLGWDPLEHPDQDLDKAEFLKSLPVVQSAVRLQQAEQRLDAVRQALENRNQASSGSTSPDPNATGTKLGQAKALIEVGKLDEAETLLREAAKDDPANTEIAYHLDRIQHRRATSGARPARQVVEVVAAHPAGESALANPYAERPPQVQTSPGRRLIMEKLNKTMLNEVKFEQLPLGEVLKELSDESIRRDPAREGVRFMIVKAVNSGVTPADGSPIQPEAATSSLDVSDTIIHINPPLQNLRLIDALNAMVMAADQRIKFTVEDFAVVFTSKPPEKEPLETREFRVHPQAFHQVLSKFGTNLPPRVFGDTAPLQQPAEATNPPVGGVRFLTTNDMSVINAAVRWYFESLGVSLTPPKTLFFNDRKGLLLVRATLEDLEIIQNAVELLNYAPPQVLLEVRAVEVTKDDVRALGLDWFVNPYLNDPPKTTNVVTGILTDPQFRIVRQAMAQHLGVEISAQHRLVTLSGRQTQVVLTNRHVNGPLQMNLIRPEAMNLILDLIPYVSPNGFTIQMTVIPTLVEFVSINEPGALIDSPNQTPNSGTGEKPLAASTPLPRYRMRQVASSVNVWDGQTIAQSYPLRVAVPSPHLAGAPTAGPDETGKGHLLIFITPTIVDAAGNAVHKPGELPLANELVPPPRPTKP